MRAYRIRLDFAEARLLLPFRKASIHRRILDYSASGREPQTNDTVWQHVECNGQPSAQVYMAPVHDVKDLIPYDQIVGWAAHAGWPVPPVDGPCVAPQVQQAPPASKHEPPGKKKKGGGD